MARDMISVMMQCIVPAFLISLRRARQGSVCSCTSSDSGLGYLRRGIAKKSTQSPRTCRRTAGAPRTPGTPRCSLKNSSPNASPSPQPGPTYTPSDISPNVQAKYSARTEPSDSVAKNAKKASAFAVSVRGRRGAAELALWALVNTLTAHRGSLPLRASAHQQDAHFCTMPASPGLPQPKAKPR